MANLNFFRGSYSKYLELVANRQIVETNLYFTLPDTPPTVDDVKSSSYCLFHGEELLACSKYESEIQDLFAKFSALEERIDNISSELATYEVSAVTVADANVKEAYAVIKTQGDKSEQVGKTIKIYKDSALQSVELSGQSLVFTYLTVSGGTEIVPVDVSTFLSESEFKDGLQVNENHEVSVKLGEDTETNKNFLDLEGDVEGEKSLAVRSIDADATVLQKDLTIAGLDGSFGAGNYSNGNVIPAGTDIYTILENILCKENYPTPSKTNANVKTSMNALTIGLDTTGTVEVGTKVTLTAGTTNGISATVTNPKISNLTDGYSLADDDTQDFSATTISGETISAVTDNTYTISAKIDSGFNADKTTNVKTVPTTQTGDGNASLVETVIGCVDEGANKITITATGATCSYSSNAITVKSGDTDYTTFYYCSNLKKTDSGKTVSLNAKANTTVAAPSATANASVTGVYKYFMGGSESLDPTTLDSDAIRALSTSGNVVANGTTSIASWTSPGYSVVIACPSKYKLATIKDSMGNSYLGKFSKTTTIAVKTGEINTNYTVYMYPLENNVQFDFTGITFTKA